MMRIIIARSWLSLCKTKWSREYRTVECPVTIQIQPIREIVAMTHIDVWTSAKSKMDPVELKAMPQVATKTLQKYSPCLFLNVENTRRFNSTTPVKAMAKKAAISIGTAEQKRSWRRALSFSSFRGFVVAERSAIKTPMD